MAGTLRGPGGYGLLWGGRGFRIHIDRHDVRGRGQGLGRLLLLEGIKPLANGFCLLEDLIWTVLVREVIRILLPAHLMATLMAWRPSYLFWSAIGCYKPILTEKIPRAQRGTIF